MRTQSHAPFTRTIEKRCTNPACDLYIKVGQQLIAIIRPSQTPTQGVPNQIQSEMGQ